MPWGHSRQTANSDTVAAVLSTGEAAAAAPRKIPQHVPCSKETLYSILGEFVCRRKGNGDVLCIDAAVDAPAIPWKHLGDYAESHSCLTETPWNSRIAFVPWMSPPKLVHGWPKRPSPPKWTVNWSAPTPSSPPKGVSLSA